MFTREPTQNPISMSFVGWSYCSSQRRPWWCRSVCPWLSGCFLLFAVFLVLFVVFLMISRSALADVGWPKSARSRWFCDGWSRWFACAWWVVCAPNIIFGVLGRASARACRPSFSNPPPFHKTLFLELRERGRRAWTISMVRMMVPRWLKRETKATIH